MPRAVQTKDRLDLADRFFQEDGVDPMPLVFIEQVHGNQVHEVKSAPIEPWHTVGQGDGLITTVPGIVLVIRTGDCVPIIASDEQAGVVAVAHAGWRGIMAGVIEETVAAMVRVHGCRVEDVSISIGPAICGRHYDVSTVQDGRVEAFQQKFIGVNGVVLEEGGKTALDLPRACQVLCERAGIHSANIAVSKECTFEQASLPSHRREGESRARDIWTWVCMKP